MQEAQDQSQPYHNLTIRPGSIGGVAHNNAAAFFPSMCFRRLHKINNFIKSRIIKFNTILYLKIKSKMFSIEN